MAVTLELRPEEITALRSRADAAGVDIETVLHGLVAQIVPLPTSEMWEERKLTEKQKALAALLQFWREEDPTDGPEELTGRDRDLEEFKANMNRWRAAEGRPPAC